MEGALVRLHLARRATSTAKLKVSTSGLQMGPLKIGQMPLPGKAATATMYGRTTASAAICTNIGEPEGKVQEPRGSSDC